MANVFNPIGEIRQGKAMTMLDGKNGSLGENIPVNKQQTKHSGTGFPLSKGYTTNFLSFPFFDRKIYVTDLIYSFFSYVMFGFGDREIINPLDSNMGLFVNTGDKFYISFLSYKYYDDRLIIRSVNENQSTFITDFELVLFKDGVIQITSIPIATEYRTNNHDGVFMISNGTTASVNRFNMNLNSTVLLVPNNDFTKYILHENSYYHFDVSEQTPLPPKNLTVTKPTLGGFTLNWENEVDTRRSTIAVYVEDILKEMIDGNRTSYIFTGMSKDETRVSIATTGRTGYQSEKISIMGRKGSLADYVIPNQVGKYSTSMTTAKLPTKSTTDGRKIISQTPNDDESFQCTMPSGFNFKYYNVNNSVYVSTNSFVTFGTGSTSYNGFSLSSTKGIYINAKDCNSRYVAEKTFDGKYHVIRYEGNVGPDSSDKSSPQYWEVTLFKDGTIQVFFESISYSNDGFSAITNGVNNQTGIVLPNYAKGKSYVFIPKENPVDGYYFAEGSYNIVDTTPTYAVPTIISNSKSKISRNTDVDRTTLKFKFDKNITQWTVNVGGSSPTTGFVADSGGAVNANVEITAIIDGSELQSEGQNRVNIYGKDESGNWTLYEA